MDLIFCLMNGMVVHTNLSCQKQTKGMVVPSLWQLGHYSSHIIFRNVEKFKVSSFFFYQICEVSGLVIVTRRHSQIWLQVKEETRKV